MSSVEPTSARARVYLIVGPVGSGKSTFAQKLALEHRALRLTLDEWMAELFRPDRPDEGVIEWYLERARRCIDLMWKMTERSIAAGTAVVLEIGLIRRGDRDRFYRRVDAGGVDLHLYLLDAPRELRRERVERRNLEKGETFSMIVPPEIFEIASDMWEPLEDDELATRNVHVVDPPDPRSELF